MNAVACPRTVIVTGASDGLGRAFAEICVNNGVRVVNISRTPAPPKQIENIACDLSDPDQIIHACEQIKTKYPVFDAIVNCAGVISLQDPAKITYDELEKTFRVNTLAPVFLVSQLFDLIKRNGADILNVGSTVAYKAYPNQSAYGASKWALRGAGENMRTELQKSNCRVISFNCGGMYTNFFAKYKAGGRKGTLAFDGDPLEWLLPADVARVMFDVLNYPKQLEVSEIVINRHGKRTGATRGE